VVDAGANLTWAADVHVKLQSLTVAGTMLATKLRLEASSTIDVSGSFAAPNATLAAPSITVIATGSLHADGAAAAGVGPVSPSLVLHSSGSCDIAGRVTGSYLAVRCASLVLQQTARLSASALGLRPIGEGIAWGALGAISAASCSSSGGNAYGCRVGAGHGGAGGAYGHPSGRSFAGGSPYGSAAAPSLPGGGSESGGARGGGVLRIDCDGAAAGGSGTLLAKAGAEVSADGAAALASRKLAGGAAGGSVWVSCASLDVRASAKITATGGAAAWRGGGGGGGRVALAYSAVSGDFAGSASVAGGEGGGLAPRVAGSSGDLSAVAVGALGSIIGASAVPGDGGRRGATGTLLFDTALPLVVSGADGGQSWVGVLPRPAGHSRVRVQPGASLLWTAGASLAVTGAGVSTGAAVYVAGAMSTADAADGAPGSRFEVRTTGSGSGASAEVRLVDGATFEAANASFVVGKLSLARGARMAVDGASAAAAAGLAGPRVALRRALSIVASGEVSVGGLIHASNAHVQCNELRVLASANISADALGFRAGECTRARLRA